MKNIKFSLIALMALGTSVYAGGDLNVVTPYEVDDMVMAEEAYVEPVVEEYVAPEPIIEETYVAPEPVVHEVVPEPKPVVKEVEPVVEPVAAVKNISPNGFYAGLGITGAQYTPNCKCTGKNSKDKTVGGMARIGYDFNKYIGIEARGIKTNWKSAGGKVQHAGLYLKPMVPIGNATNVYGLVGFGKTTTKGSLQKTNAEAMALGLGVEVDLSKDTPKDGRYGRKFDGKGDQEKGLGVFADYERMVVKSGAPKLDAVSAGVTYDF